MKPVQRTMQAIALLAAVGASASALAADDAAALPCADYMAMSQADQVKAVGELISTMPEGAMPKEKMADTSPSMSEMGTGGTSGGAMAPDIMVSMASDACEANAGASVGEAIEMMQDS